MSLHMSRRLLQEMEKRNKLNTVDNFDKSVDNFEDKKLENIEEVSEDEVVDKKHNKKKAN